MELVKETASTFCPLHFEDRPGKDGDSIVRKARSMVPIRCLSYVGSKPSPFESASICRHVGLSLVNLG